VVNKGLDGCLADYLSTEKNEEALSMKKLPSLSRSCLPDGGVVFLS